MFVSGPMSGAVFFLAVNFIVAMCFCAVFAVVASRSRSRMAAIWFAVGFGVASLSALCEILVAYTGYPMLFAVSAFSTVLGGMILLFIGVCQMYGTRCRWWLAAGFFLLSLVVCILIYPLPRGTPVQAFSYQAPFAIVVLANAYVVMTARRRLPIDRALGWLMLVTGLHFLAKAALAVAVGSGATAKDYINTNYALISQSMTAVLMVSVGLTLLSVLVLEIMTDERTASESDSLSGLANRRGFERGVAALLARAPAVSHCVVVCDLDHFKSINDTFGHDGGDRVIRAFGALLRDSAPRQAVAARLGGEEFAVFLPDAAIEMSVLFAQALRNGTMALAIEGIPDDFSITASFGVARLSGGESLDSVLRRADMALYAAKRAGRNCVKQAGPEAGGAGSPRPAHLRPVR